MTFQQLQYILEISRNKSVSGAAKALFISPSSVSICLAALEKELGYPLFSRTQNGLIPTEQGLQVLDYANQICRTHALLNKVGEESVRTLRIGCTDQPPTAKAYAQLLWENKDRTDLKIENVSYSGNAVYEKLMAHDMDVSIYSVISYGFGALERRLRKGGLHQQLLKTVPATIHVGPAHRLYNAERITPYDLRNDSFIDNPHHSLAKDSGISHSLYLDPGKILYLARPAVRRQALQQGLGFTIGVMPPKGTQSPLRYIPLEGAFFHFCALTYTDAPAQPEVLRFLELAKENLDEAYPDDYK